METTTRRIILALLGLLQRYYCTPSGTQYLSKILSRVPSQQRKNLSQVLTTLCSDCCSLLLISFLALLFSTFFASSLSPFFSFALFLCYLWAQHPSVLAALLQ